MDTKKVPELDFRVDESLKKQAEVFEALARARAATPLLRRPLVSPRGPRAP